MNLFKTMSLAAIVYFSALSSQAFAMHHEGAVWQLVPDDSIVAYGSIKANVAGEVNTFNKIEGAIVADGQAMISIELTSVNTNVDIRNQRMIKYVFGDNTKAVLTTQLDMEAIKALSIADTATMEVEGVLSFLGEDIDVDTNFFVVKLSDSKILATTDSMIMMQTEELGVNAGLDKLMELAKLPSITRVSPITLRFVFEMDK